MCLWLSAVSTVIAVVTKPDCWCCLKHVLLPTGSHQGHLVQEVLRLKSMYVCSSYYMLLIAKLGSKVQRAHSSWFIQPLCKPSVYLRNGFSFLVHGRLVCMHASVPHMCKSDACHLDVSRWDANCIAHLPCTKSTLRISSFQSWPVPGQPIIS